MNSLARAERAAETRRASFALAFEELDRRRKLAADLPYQLRRHLSTVLLAAGVVGAGFGAGAYVAKVRRRNASRLHRQALRRALRRAYDHPDRLANHVPKGRFLGQLVRRVVLAFAGTLAAQLARSTAQLLLAPGVPCENAGISKRAGGHA